MKEHVLSINDFNMPKVFDENDSNYVLLIRLILLEPGKFQSHPTMGIGIKSRYRFNNNEDFMDSLRSDLRNQINKFSPWIVTTEITITRKENTLGFIINTAEGAYVISYNTSKNVAEAAATYVLDDL